MLGAALVNPAEAFGRLPAFYRKPGSTASVVTVQVGTEPWIKIVKKSSRHSAHLCHTLLARLRYGGQIEQGGSHGGGRDHKAHPMVEGANQGSMAGLVRRLARLDPGRLRFHDFPADHAADLA